MRDAKNLYEAIVLDVGACHDVAVEIDVRRPGSDAVAHTLRYSAGGAGGYQPLVIETSTFSRDMVGGGGDIGGPSTPAIGDLRLVNVNGQLDNLENECLEGGEIRIKHAGKTSDGREIDPHQMDPFLVQKVRDVLVSRDQAVIGVVDSKQSMDVQLGRSYRGTGPAWLPNGVTSFLSTNFLATAQSFGFLFNGFWFGGPISRAILANGPGDIVRVLSTGQVQIQIGGIAPGVLTSTDAVPFGESFVLTGHFNAVTNRVQVWLNGKRIIFSPDALGVHAPGAGVVLWGAATAVPVEPWIGAFFEVMLWRGDVPEQIPEDTRCQYTPLVSSGYTLEQWYKFSRDTVGPVTFVNLADPNNGAAVLSANGPSIFSSSLEGSVDIAGDAKPRIYGCVKNSPATLLDDVTQVYQVSDGPISHWERVTDGGADLTFQTMHTSLVQFLLTAPTPGRWSVYPPLGLIRLGSTPTFEVGFWGCGATDGSVAPRPTGIQQLSSDLSVPLAPVGLSGAVFGWFYVDPTYASGGTRVVARLFEAGLARIDLEVRWLSGPGRFEFRAVGAATSTIMFNGFLPAETLVGRWWHVCMTWNAVTGTLGVFLNGRFIANDTSVANTGLGLSRTMQFSPVALAAQNLAFQNWGVVTGILTNLEEATSTYSSGGSLWQGSTRLAGWWLMEEMRPPGAPNLTPHIGYWENRSSAQNGVGAIVALPPGLGGALNTLNGPVVHTAASVVRTAANDTGNSIDEESVDRLQERNVAELGIFLGNDSTSLDVIDIATDAVRGFWGFNRVGEIDAGLVEPPEDRPDEDLVESLECEISRVEVRGSPAIFRRRSICYCKNQQAFSDSDIAGVVTGTDREFLLKELRCVCAGDSEIADCFPLALSSEERDTALVSQLDAYEVARRELRLLGKRRHVALVKGPSWLSYLPINSLLEISLHDTLDNCDGDVVRLGLDNRRVILVGIEDDAAGETTLKIWY